MPKKVDYREELKALKSVPDTTQRPVTARISVRCLRQLYRVCSEGHRDLGSVVRQILEEQVGAYLTAGKEDSQEPLPIGPAWDAVLRELPGQVRSLAVVVCEGLAIEFPTLVEQALAEALPDLALRAEKARRLREDALARLQGRPTPEAVAFESYCLAAPACYSSAFAQLREMVAEGEVTLELAGVATLYLIAPGSAAAEPGSDDTLRKEGAFQTLVTAGILVAESGADPYRKIRRPPQARVDLALGGKWRLNPQALSGEATSSPELDATNLPSPTS